MERVVIEEHVGNPEEMTYGLLRYRMMRGNDSCQLTLIEGPYGKWRWYVDTFEGSWPSRLFNSRYVHVAGNLWAPLDAVEKQAESCLQAWLAEYKTRIERNGFASDRAQLRQD